MKRASAARALATILSGSTIVPITAANGKVYTLEQPVPAITLASEATDKAFTEEQLAALLMDVKSSPLALTNLDPTKATVVAIVCKRGKHQCVQVTSNTAGNLAIRNMRTNGLVPVDAFVIFKAD